jgi:VanZ family protein
VHLVLYSLLLVATPFCMLRAFLQEAVGRLSRLEFEVGGIHILVVPTLGGIVLLVGFVVLLRHLTIRRVLGLAVAVLLVLLGHQIADYYFDHRYFDIQHNWHYAAYLGFAVMVHRDLATRGYPLRRVTLAAYGLALGFSTFDECFQLLMAYRVFDLGDTAKDLWGCYIGLVLLTFWTTDPTPRQVRGLLVLLGLWALWFLIVSSNLTDARNWHWCVAITLAGGAVIGLLYRLLAARRTRPFVLTFLGLALLVQLGFYLHHRTGEKITHSRYGLTVIQGIPIPVFDVLVYPNGTFRIVDKKHSFSRRDLRLLLRLDPDIIVFGTGFTGTGGHGLPGTGTSRFVYNAHLRRGTQLVVLETPEAVREYHRLRQAGKHVLLVLHTTG